MNKELTALELLATRSTEALCMAHQIKDETITKQPFNMASYREGQAIAFSDAHKIMEKELRRLCNLFQNGALSIDSFNIVL
jgi:hypothetical protein